ncbi:unnamed protein product [Rotaria sp. Silwood1]|nr:unnamed protein product [Rotaria sp. Silwood1]
MYGIFVDFPLMIMDKLGLPVNFFQINPALCSICIWGSIIGMTSSIAIGLGVGLGVGMHCAKSQSVVANTLNTANTVTTANTISTANIVNTSNTTNTNYYWLFPTF